MELNEIPTAAEMALKNPKVVEIVEELVKKLKSNVSFGMCSTYTECSWSMARGVAAVFNARGYLTKIEENRGKNSEVSIYLS